MQLIEMLILCKQIMSHRSQLKNDHPFSNNIVNKGHVLVCDNPLQTQRLGMEDAHEARVVHERKQRIVPSLSTHYSEVKKYPNERNKNT
jgi:hypothetical protein